MKGKTSTVGGSPTTGLGQDFNSFLQGGLNSGNFGNNAVAQTSGFGGAINSLLGGQIGDPKTLQGFLQGLQGNGGAGNLPNVFGNLPQIMQGQQQAGLNMQQGNLGAAGLDPNGSFSQALQQISNQQLNSSVADMRERYTGQSGTPAGFAEALLRSQAIPQMTAALGNANAQERGLNLQQSGLGLQQQLGLNSNLLQQMSLGNDALSQFNAANLQNAQLGMQGQQYNAQNQLQNQQQMNQFGLGQAGIGMQNQQQQLQAILGALGPLFGGMQQATGMATPQAQTVQSPSMFSQITGALGNIGGFLGGLGGLGNLGSLFGGGGVPLVNGQNGMFPGQGVGAMPLNIPQFQMPVLR